MIRLCTHQSTLGKTPHGQTALQNQIAATDRHIDRPAYDLYGLTAEEIAVVEGKALMSGGPSSP